MEISIKDGNGGNIAAVDADNKLQVQAVSTSLQHFLSHHKQLAYQVTGEITIAGTTDQPVLILQNNDQNHDMVISFLRLETMGVAVATTSAYFTVRKNDVYTSGGTAALSENMSFGSANVADVIEYSGGNSLLISGGVEIDRNYQANSMETYNKDGSIVIPKSKSLSIWFKASTAAGIARARISYYLDHPTV